MSPSFTAVITGGNKGIGAALANEMLDAGYKVLCISRREPEFSHKNLEFYKADLFDKAHVSGVAKTIAAQHDVSHLVHNAGMIIPNLVEEAEPDDISNLAQLHLGSALTLLKAFLPSMKERNFGRVLFNGSRAALGAKTRTAYSASKAGMIGMARTWALELAQHQITVNVVAPGPVLTDNFWGIIPRGVSKKKSLLRIFQLGGLAQQRTSPMLSCSLPTPNPALSPDRHSLYAAE